MSELLDQALGEQERLIESLTLDIDSMKANKEITDIRLNGFEKWLEDQTIYPDVLDVFKKMVRNEFK